MHGMVTFSCILRIDNYNQRLRTITTKTQRTQRTHKENYKIGIMTFLFVRLCAFFVNSVSLW